MAEIQDKLAKKLERDREGVEQSLAEARLAQAERRLQWLTKSMQEALETEETGDALVRVADARRKQAAQALALDQALNSTTIMLKEVERRLARCLEVIRQSKAHATSMDEVEEDAGIQRSQTERWGRQRAETERVRLLAIIEDDPFRPLPVQHVSLRAGLQHAAARRQILFPQEHTIFAWPRAAFEDMAEPAGTPTTPTKAKPYVVYLDWHGHFATDEEMQAYSYDTTELSGL